jgi:hypothetical protein
VSDTFKYRAFLSYSPVDSGVARRVRGRLEGFRVDRELVGCPTRVGPVPESLRPIFSDRHDFFASPSLGSATVAALADPAALVILASPHSVRSRYVNKQIKFFKLRHPERPVIVLIVEGTLDDPERTGGPSALRFAVAPDWAGPADSVPHDLYESDGFDLAIAKVIARLIGLACGTYMSAPKLRDIEEAEFAPQLPRQWRCWRPQAASSSGNRTKTGWLWPNSPLWQKGTSSQARRRRRLPAPRKASPRRSPS